MCIAYVFMLLFNLKSFCAWKSSLSLKFKITNITTNINCHKWEWFVPLPSSISVYIYSWDIGRGKNDQSFQGLQKIKFTSLLTSTPPWPLQHPPTKQQHVYLIVGGLAGPSSPPGLPQLASVESHNWFMSLTDWSQVTRMLRKVGCMTLGWRKFLRSD